MRLAICGGSRLETQHLCRSAREYCARTGISAEIQPLYDLNQLWEGFVPGAWQGVVIGVGDTAGFLAARRLRESDRNCRLVCIDDTPRYAIQYVRIHAADFLLRPFRDDQLRRALGRLTGLE